MSALDTSTLIEAMFYRFKQMRLDRNQTGAEKASIALRRLLDSPEHATNLPAWSRYWYEQASFDKTLGHTVQAISGFEMSSKFAHDAGRPVSAFFNDLHVVLVRYHAGQIAADIAFHCAVETYQNFMRLGIVSDVETGMYRNATFVFLKRLVELSFEAGEAQAFRDYATQVRRNDVMRDYRARGEISIALFELQLNAREYMNQQAIESASATFLQIIPAEIPGLEDSARDDRSRTIRVHASEKYEELLRDYRDFGRCILKLDLDEASRIATYVRKQGLALGLNATPLFKSQIEQDLACLEMN